MASSAPAPATPPAPTAPPPVAPPAPVGPAPAAPVAPAPPTGSPGAPEPTPAPAAPPDAAAPTSPPPSTPPPSAPLPPPTDIGFGAAPAPEDSSELERINPLAEISFETNPGWHAGLDLYAGLGALLGTDTRGSYAFGGALLRGRYKYYQIGGFYEFTDDPLTSAGAFKAFGGFVGAWLPFDNWVDFEGAVGIGSRTYRDQDPRFGPNGYELSGPTLNLRAGVYDRAGSGLIGGRIGAQIVSSYDLKQRDRAWQLNSRDEDGDLVVTRGVSHVGGLSIGLVLTVGLDVGKGP
jgi:hypothetical protein